MTPKTKDTLAALDRIVASESVHSAWAALTEEMTHYGFDRLFYGFTRFHTAQGLGAKDDFLVLSNMPDGFIETYLERELYRDAPMTQWARDNVGAKSWSWIAQNKDQLNERQKNVLSFNLSHGVTAGYTISFRDAVTRHKGAIALAARPGLTQDDVDAIWSRHGTEINILNQVAHLKFASLPLPQAKARLSARQREVLEWVGDGKTAADIATIMGVTSTTVEKHLRKAREALSVDTTAQAVMKAAFLNHIFVIETDFTKQSRR